MGFSGSAIVSVVLVRQVETECMIDESKRFDIGEPHSNWLQEHHDIPFYYSRLQRKFENDSVTHIRGKELYDDLFSMSWCQWLADTPLAKSTSAPKLAGQFSDGEYAEGIKVVQQGVGTMPAYEMIIDKHDTKRILIYLGGLDPETGIDPRVKSEEDEKSEKKSKEGSKMKSKDPVQTETPKKPEGKK